MCRNVQCLTTNPPCLSTPDRRKPILAGGDGRHCPPEGHALQRPAAPHSPQQPQISLSTAGLPGKENPGKCYRKSLENQTKLSPRRISQRPWQSCCLPKPTVLQPLAGRLAYTLFLRFLSPSFLCEEQERLCASQTTFLQQLLPPVAPPGFYSVCKSLCAVRSTVGAPLERLLLGISPPLAMGMLCANG